MNGLTKAIEVWAINRNLHDGDHKMQLLKIGEEFGELCEGVVKGDVDQERDSIGDLFITLVIYALQRGYHFEGCVLDAYNQIKDRKGRIVNGSFIKEEDLS